MAQSTGKHAIDTSAPVRRLFAAMLMLAALPYMGCGNNGGGGVFFNGPTRRPIKHLIIVVPENRSFDNVFATYRPGSRQTVWNLLSRGIVKADGTPGPKFSMAAQVRATDNATYQIAPTPIGRYRILPHPGLRHAIIVSPGILAPALLMDPGLYPADWPLLLTGTETYSPCTPDPEFSILCLGENFDFRYPAKLPNGPYRITGPNTPYVSYYGDPPHRFYQNWQQLDCAKAHATKANPSGCKADLFAWVDETVGTGGNGNPVPSPTYNGSVAMGYYDMAVGDFPYLRKLAQRYAISDNYHQAVLGGTLTNHQAMVAGDQLFYSDGNGNRVRPPQAVVENPNPVPGTDNWYANDGETLNGSSGAYSNCSASAQPGVGPILNYLNSLPYQPFNNANCAKSTYYLLNNNPPAFTTDGMPSSPSLCPAGIQCIVPPSSVRTIGDALAAKHLSWRFYGEGFDSANNPPPDPSGLLYDAVGNPFQYSKSIMTTSLRNNLEDLGAFFDDVDNGKLAAVSFVKPDTLIDGHPGTSDAPLVEAFLHKIVDAVQANQALWSQTAIIITFDESGGYYDSGYVQPIDFFGDGPRVPLIVVSPFARRGFVDHTYADHASILKFIEFNWKLGRLSDRSRDNLPNPTASRAQPYFPLNPPAIGDLTTLFAF